MIKYDTIYKRTSTGATQIWYVEQEGDKYRTISGQIDGKHTTSAWTVAKPTNIGRANHRDGEAQATFEVNAAYTKKLEKDYHKTPDTIDTVIIYKPMLAHDYNDYKDKIPNSLVGIFAQPKLDGLRAIANRDGLWSRNGKPHMGAPHIMEALAETFRLEPNLVLDGELYNHEYKNDFNTIVSAVKKQSPSDAELEIARKVVQYHIYDIPSEQEVFSVRADRLEDFVQVLNHPHIIGVDTHLVQTVEHLDELYGQFIAEGYEGQMVRLDAPYEQKRSRNLLKRKEFIDEEFELVRLETGIGNWSGYAKRAILRLKDGREFGAGVKGTQAYTKDILANQHLYVNKPATVRYFALTPDGVPRFPVLKELAREF
jgi:DNA ligase-1